MSDLTVSKTDFIYFQNDILKDLKNLENKLNNKLVFLLILIFIFLYY